MSSTVDGGTIAASSAVAISISAGAASSASSVALGLGIGQCAQASDTTTHLSGSQAAKKVATVALASTIGVFGSSQIAFAAGTADVPEPPAIISPAAGDTAATTKPVDSIDVVKAPDKDAEAGNSKGDANGRSNAGTAEGAERAVETAAPSDADAAIESSASDTLTASALALDPTEAEGFSLMDTRAGIVDEATLLQAIADGNTAVTLNGSFTITQPIPVTEEGFNIVLNGNTLTCTGSAFKAAGDATIVIIGPGTLNASGSLVSATSGGYVSSTQINGTVSAPTISNYPSNWSYGLMSGTLSLSKTVEMGANTSLTVNSGTTFSSTAAGSAVHLANSQATFKIDGTFTATGNGVAMEAGTKLTVSNNATVNTGGNAIIAGSNCDVSIGRGSKITAGGKVMSVGSSSASGTHVESGPNVSLSDGTIAMYMSPGTVIEFDHDKFVTVLCANPQAMGWYGAIDGVWCPTQADFDGLLKKIPDGHEEVTRYSVSFSGLDGSSLGTVSVRKGHCVGDSFTPGAPKAPTVRGKRFSCWKDASGNTYDTTALAKVAVNGDTTYTAHYVEDTGGSEGAGTVNPTSPNAGNSGNSGGFHGGGGFGSGSRTPRVPTPSSGWLPADLAMAAGFTVPTSGPGVVAMNELDEAAGAGGDKLNENPTPEASLYDVRPDDGFSHDGPAVARVIALGCGVVLAAVLAARVAGGFAASAKAARTRRRKALGLD